MQIHFAVTIGVEHQVTLKCPESGGAQGNSNASSSAKSAEVSSGETTDNASLMAIFLSISRVKFVEILRKACRDFKRSLDTSVRFEENFKKNVNKCCENLAIILRSF